jgi:hypothetical protein
MLSKWSAAARPPLAHKHTSRRLGALFGSGCGAQHPEWLHWERRVKNNAQFKQFYELHVKIAVAHFRVYMAARRRSKSGFIGAQSWRVRVTGIEFCDKWKAIAQ